MCKIVFVLKVQESFLIYLKQYTYIFLAFVWIEITYFTFEWFFSLERWLWNKNQAMSMNCSSESWKPKPKCLSNEMYVYSYVHMLVYVYTPTWEFLEGKLLHVFHFLLNYEYARLSYRIKDNPQRHILKMKYRSNKFNEFLFIAHILTFYVGKCIFFGFKMQKMAFWGEHIHTYILLHHIRVVERE